MRIIMKIQNINHQLRIIVKFPYVYAQYDYLIENDVISVRN